MHPAFAQDAPEVPAADLGGSGVYISLRSASLVIEPWDGAEFDVSIKRHGISPDHGNDDFVIERGGNALRVEQRRTGSFVMWMLSVFETSTVRVKVPKSYSGDMRIKVSSGNLDIENIHAVCARECLPLRYRDTRVERERAEF